MDPWLKIFIAATAVAVVLQLVVLTVMAVSLRKTASRLESMAAEIQQRAVPMLDTANAILADSRGKMEVITSNLAETTTRLRGQMERLDGAVNDIVDRARLQVIRADEMVSRTLDKVEETTEVVQHSVMSPVRQVAGLAQGLSAGIAAYFGLRRRGSAQQTQDEELFI